MTCLLRGAFTKPLTLRTDIAISLPDQGSTKKLSHLFDFIGFYFLKWFDFFYIHLDLLPLAVPIDRGGSAITGWTDSQEPR
jgi:hypothetical protein